MTDTHSVTVNILDKEYCIGCPDSEREKLEKTARYLDERMRQVRKRGKIIGTERIAVMAALHISHELLHNTPQAMPLPLDDPQLSNLLARADLALQDDH